MINYEIKGVAEPTELFDWVINNERWNFRFMYLVVKNVQDGDRQRRYTVEADS